MQTIHLNASIGDDGILKIEMPTEYKNVSAEVVLVIQPALPAEKRLSTEFFEHLDAIDTDDMDERPNQGSFETREPIE